MARTTRYNETSSFPNSVDDLLFCNDIDLEHLQESNYHNQLALAQQYTQAGEYLEQTANMDSLCASLFNLIKNRIYNTQQYLLTKHTKWYEEYGVESPISWNDEPEDKEKQPVWTGE